MEPYSPFLEVLVGPQELQHLRFCLEELREQHLLAEREGHRPLIIVDGLDGWLDALIRHPDTENLSTMCSRKATGAATRCCSPLR